MKNIVLLLVCAFLFCKPVFSDIDGMSSLAIKPGWIYQKVNWSDNEDPTVHLISIGAKYKYQHVSEIYAYLKANYAFDIGSNKCCKKTYDFYNWNAEAAIGYTFEVSESGMLSPFLAVGYNFFREKRLEQKTTSLQLTLKGEDNKFRGFYGMIGADFQYLFANNFMVGLLAAVGMHVNSYLYKQRKSKEPDGTVKYYPQNKLKAKNRVFFKAALPIVYYINDMWKLGVEFSYLYLPIKTTYQGNSHNEDIQQFGAAVVAGVDF